jgi:phytoene dehydrogenase-like protein
MAKAAAENGATIHLSKPVKEIITEDGRARGVLLASGDTDTADEIHHQR